MNCFLIKSCLTCILSFSCYWVVFEGGKTICVPDPSVFKGGESLFVKPGEINFCPNTKVLEDEGGDWLNPEQFKQYGKLFIFKNFILFYKSLFYL